MYLRHPKRPVELTTTSQFFPPLQPLQHLTPNPQLRKRHWLQSCKSCLEFSSAPCPTATTLSV